ncbi:hypothetical protein, partial [Streptomyces puniciscabiei]|uniref:hypothetical protein n=1 Tax=Streptomyces puniciscabiei TaxID=164348 RepID=UPI001F22E8EA
MAADSLNGSNGTGGAVGRGDIPSSGFLTKMWGSRLIVALASLACLVAAAAAVVPVASAPGIRESPRLSASAVAGGPSLSNGRTVRISEPFQRG